MSPFYKQSKISPELYDELAFHFKYASSAYSILCPRPNGKELVHQFFNPLTETQGFIARDDDREEIVLAMRGSLTIVDILLDTQVLLVPFISPGVRAPGGTRVHAGFLAAWDSVALDVVRIVDAELQSHSGYTLAACGHSLGGSIACLAAVSLVYRFPQRTRLYTYGAPRSGNHLFAELVNEKIGLDSFRVVHGDDGVPTMIPRAFGYHHHGVEYWQQTEPSSPENVRECSQTEGEDPECSLSIPSRGITSCHFTYFDVVATTPFCF